MTCVETANMEVFIMKMARTKKSTTNLVCILQHSYATLLLVFVIRLSLTAVH